MINNNVIGSTETALLTVPAGKNYANVTVLLCNTSSTLDEIVTIYAKVSGSGVDGNTIIKEFVIPAKDTFVFESKLLLGEANVISAKGANGAICTATLSYLEI